MQLLPVRQGLGRSGARRFAFCGVLCHIKRFFPKFPPETTCYTSRQKSHNIIANAVIKHEIFKERKHYV